MAAQYLATDLRRRLEKAIREAREVAEAGAADAVRRLGVADPAGPVYLDEESKKLRRHLRAHARSLGDPLVQDRQETTRLIEAAAYAHWHRMLFARFLAERGLLRHPAHDVPVSLEDCRELAGEEGLADGWAVAERYAAAMLPAAFQPDDPVLALAFAPEHAQRLQGLVIGLDGAVFAADDSLGWTYQFWRSAEKDAVNKSGVKIGADELPAVTQLFTEPYMVRFLLHNTLGAWWAGKVLAGNPELAKTTPDEAALRKACALPSYGWEMLRFVREDGAWRPAAGTFPGWPTEARAITVLDPCCGSGHFLTEALAILSALRQEEEGLSPEAAVAATLRDNLHGLEIDERCVQIAAFAVALTAWRIGGWQALPLPHVAWVGAPPPLPRKDFVALANGDADLARALAALHDLFAQAPLLGSLIEPIGGDLADPRRVERVESLLDQLVAKVRAAAPERVEGAVAARGMADAAALLARQYTLQATNVPFLGRGKQEPALAAHIAAVCPEAKADLATAMVVRLLDLSVVGGVVASVSPHNWFFTRSYSKFRRKILSAFDLAFAATLGEEAWLEFGDRGPLAVMTAIRKNTPNIDSNHFVIDALPIKNRKEKIEFLTNGKVNIIRQDLHFNAVDSRIMLESFLKGALLKDYCDVHEGLHTGDYPQFGRAFWEILSLGDQWRYQQGGTGETDGTGGCEYVLLWENGKGRLISQVEERLKGQPISMWIKGCGAWGRNGITIGTMRGLKHARYFGALFTHGIYVVTPKEPSFFPALLAFSSSRKLAEAVRKIDKRVVISKPAIEEVPFDFESWDKVALTKFSNNCEPPLPLDPGQWIFHGHPGKAKIGGPLHIGLARLCGYRWPAEIDDEMRVSDEARACIEEAARLPPGDADGLLCLPAVGGERPLAERLRAYLAAAFGAEWCDALEGRLVAEADERFDKKAAKDGSLDAWLRDRAFRQHCKLFHDRPFLWQVWDGLKNGFSVFIHYHRLDQATLRKLTFTLLNDWLARAKAEKNDLRVEKARELQRSLEAILEGEKPYDIFVRWKPLARQPLGWDPDLDDGVRMNIRPFVKAGILRDTPNIKWTSDRGADVKSAPWYPVFKGERINDHHTTLAEKEAARAPAKPGEPAE